MGQYWKIVNLDRREYVNCGRLGGLKLWEQIANWPSGGTALIILCAAEREVCGGGDLDLDENWHGPERDVFGQHACSPGPMPDDYPEIARATIGRWAGSRIALVGDYAERDDLPPELNADLIYDLCNPEERVREIVTYYHAVAEEHRQRGNDGLAEAYDDKARRLREELGARGPYKDVTDLVIRVMMHELHDVLPHWFNPGRQGEEGGGP